MFLKIIQHTRNAKYTNTSLFVLKIIQQILYKIYKYILVLSWKQFGT